MKVIMMLKRWIPAPDMYIMNAFMTTLLPGPNAISIALCRASCTVDIPGTWNIQKYIEIRKDGTILSSVFVGLG